MFHPIKVLDPIIGFVKSCPFLDSKVINIGEIELSYQDANAISYSGTPEPIIKSDIYGSFTSEKQANFVLYLKRPKYDDFARKEATEFLINFENWVEYENLLGDPPKIGDYPADERIWADNGMFYGVVDEKSNQPEHGIYQIQLHIRYKLDYEAK